MVEPTFPMLAKLWNDLPRPWEVVSHLAHALFGSDDLPKTRADWDARIDALIESGEIGEKLAAERLHRLGTQAAQFRKMRDELYDVYTTSESPCQVATIARVLKKYSS
jgi:hypothetical protein